MRCAGSRVRGDAPADHDLRHDHRPVRPHALRPDDRGLLQLGAPRRAHQRWGSTAPSVPISCGPTSRSSRGSAVVSISAHPNAGLPNEFGGYDLGPGGDGDEVGRLGALGLPQHRRRLLRDDAGAHPRRSPRACEGTPRGSSPEIAPACRLSGLEPSTSRGQLLRERRRAHQRHRLGALQAADPRR
jgi:hypothetical protein